MTGGREEEALGIERRQRADPRRDAESRADSGVAHPKREAAAHREEAVARRAAEAPLSELEALLGRTCT